MNGCGRSEKEREGGCDMICENVVNVRTPLATIYSVLIERLGMKTRKQTLAARREETR